MAARRTFAERGYRDATVRRVAEAAGVDPALVHHYFATKEGLFAEAVGLPVAPSEVRAAMARAPGREGEALVEALLAAWDADGGEAVAALVRSAVSHEAAAQMLRDFLTAAVLGPLARRSRGRDGALRAAVVASHVVGLALGRYVVALPALARAPRDRLVALVGPTLQRYLVPEEPC